MTSITILILRSVVWSNDVGEQAQSACFSPDGEVTIIFRNMKYFYQLFHLEGHCCRNHHRQVGGAQFQHSRGVQC